MEKISMGRSPKERKPPMGLKERIKDIIQDCRLGYIDETDESTAERIMAAVREKIATDIEVVNTSYNAGWKAAVAYMQEELGKL